MVTELNTDLEVVLTDEVMQLDDDLVEYLQVVELLHLVIVLEHQLYEVELDETVQELEEYDDELLEEQVLEVMELPELEELKLEDEVVETLEVINLTDEMVVELMDTEVEVDGGEVTEVYEMVVEMMIRGLDEEVDM